MKAYFKKHIYTLPLFALMVTMMFSACSEEQEVAEPDLEISVEKTTIAAGDTAKFKFDGTADVITFFSGERGKEFKHRSRTTVVGKPQFQFSSNRRFGSPTIAVDNTLKVLISTDFKGAADIATLNSATWTDISDKAKLSTNLGGGTTLTQSGVIDLSNFHTPGVPAYIAFKFQDIQSTLSQRTWVVQDLAIETKIDDGSLLSIANMGNMNWSSVNVAGTQTWSTTATQASMAGGAANTPNNEDWLITQRLYLDRVPRDQGVNVKGNPISKLGGYEYVFNVPGTYTVTFEAINANKWDKKSKVQEFTITVQ